MFGANLSIVAGGFQVTLFGPLEPAPLSTDIIGADVDENPESRTSCCKVRGKSFEATSEWPV